MTHTTAETMPVAGKKTKASLKGLSPRRRVYEVGMRALIYAAAAQWAERDVAELVPITFEGLDCSQRLFMPDNLLSGQGQITVTPLNVLRGENQL